MQYDYYAFRKGQLSDFFNELEQASAELERAKKQKDKEARQQAERKIEKTADKVVQLEPHLAYVWYETQASDLKNSIRNAWQNHLTASAIPAAFCLTPSFSALNHLPLLSFMLRVTFKLQKPYLSKDDRTFHLLDNPVRKDKVFQTPMVASTSWKGALHMAMLQLLAEWWCGLDEMAKNDRGPKKEFIGRRISLGRLFGTEKGVQIDDRKFESYLDGLGGNNLAQWYRRYIRRYISSTGFFSGCLYFYPTFFDKIGLEVINPHDRKTGTGKNPILIECVPIGATGDFVILYVPFGKIDESLVAKDLEVLAKGVEAMLAVYGFGAKTSSGFGIAEVNGKINFAIRADWSELKQPKAEVKPPEPDLPRYLIAPEQIDPDFLNPDGSFKSEAEYIQGKSAKKAKQLYDKAIKWWDSEQLRLAETAKVEPIPEPESPPKPTMTEVSFDKLSELGDRTQQIAEHLHQSEEISHDS